MIGAFLSFGLAQSPAEPAIVSERQTIELPNEVAPAIVPYLMCMLQDVHGRVIGSRSGQQARVAIEQLKADCRPERDRAELAAREMLRSSRVPESSRERMIADALATVDHSKDNIAERLDRARGTENGKTD